MLDKQKIILEEGSDIIVLENAKDIVGIELNLGGTIINLVEVRALPGTTYQGIPTNYSVSKDNDQSIIKFWPLPTKDYEMMITYE